MFKRKGGGRGRGKSPTKNRRTLRSLANDFSPFARRFDTASRWTDEKDDEESGGGGSSRKQANVNIPFVDFSFIVSAQDGLTVDFTNLTQVRAGATQVEANWVFNDGKGSVGTGNTPRNTFPAPGTYQVLLEVLTSEGYRGQVIREVMVDGQRGPFPVITINYLLQSEDSLEYTYVVDAPSGDLEYHASQLALADGTVFVDTATTERLVTPPSAQDPSGTQLHPVPLGTPEQTMELTVFARTVAGLIASEKQTVLYVPPFPIITILYLEQREGTIAYNYNVSARGRDLVYHYVELLFADGTVWKRADETQTFLLPTDADNQEKFFFVPYTPSNTPPGSWTPTPSQLITMNVYARTEAGRTATATQTVQWNLTEQNHPVISNIIFKQPDGQESDWDANQRRQLYIQYDVSHPNGDTEFFTHSVTYKDTGLLIEQDGTGQFDPNFFESGPLTGLQRQAVTYTGFVYTIVNAPPQTFVLTIEARDNLLPTNNKTSAQVEIFYRHSLYEDQADTCEIGQFDLFQDPYEPQTIRFTENTQVLIPRTRILGFTITIHELDDVQELQPISVFKSLPALVNGDRLQFDPTPTNTPLFIYADLDSAQQNDNNPVIVGMKLNIPPRPGNYRVVIAHAQDTSNATFQVCNLYRKTIRIT